MQTGPDYIIAHSQFLENREDETRENLADGWQLASPLFYAEGEFFQPMLKFPAPPMEQGQSLADAAQEQAAEDFQKKWEDMDAEVRDLLLINNIDLFTQNGQLFTRVGDKIRAGIAPNEVLSLLKESKHCPMDLDEQKVLNAIEGLL